MIQFIEPDNTGSVRDLKKGRVWVGPRKVRPRPDFPSKTLGRVTPFSRAWVISSEPCEQMMLLFCKLNVQSSV